MAVADTATATTSAMANFMRDTFWVVIVYKLGNVDISVGGKTKTPHPRGEAFLLWSILYWGDKYPF